MILYWWTFVWYHVPSQGRVIETLLDQRREATMPAWLLYPLKYSPISLMNYQNKVLHNHATQECVMFIGLQVVATLTALLPLLITTNVLTPLMLDSLTQKVVHV